MSFHELVDGRTRPLAVPASVQAERKSRASCLRCNATRSTESNYDKSLRACVCVCVTLGITRGLLGLVIFKDRRGPCFLMILMLLCPTQLCIREGSIHRPWMCACFPTLQNDFWSRSQTGGRVRRQTCQ